MRSTGIPTVRISGSSTSISRLGFGCGRILGGQESRASAKLIETALRLGIRHFDTAPSYGGGESEELLGALLADLPDVTIATKVGLGYPRRIASNSFLHTTYRTLLRPLLGHFPGVKARILSRFKSGVDRAQKDGTWVSGRRSLQRDDVLFALDASLKRLRRHRIDLYLIHEPVRVDLTEDLRELFVNLKKEGVIGAFGLAWGGSAESAIPFGSVVQSRYSTMAISAANAANTSIFHGVLRYGYHAERKAAESPGNYVHQVLSAQNNSAVIFSASSARQIEGLVAGLCEKLVAGQPGTSLPEDH